MWSIGLDTCDILKNKAQHVEFKLAFLVSNFQSYMRFRASQQISDIAKHY